MQWTKGSRIESQFARLLHECLLMLCRKHNRLCGHANGPPKVALFSLSWNKWTLNDRTVECFPRFCFVVKRSADKMILQIFDIFSHDFSLFSTQMTLFGSKNSIGKHSTVRGRVTNWSPNNLASCFHCSLRITVSPKTILFSLNKTWLESFKGVCTGRMWHQVIVD